MTMKSTIIVIVFLFFVQAVLAQTSDSSKVTQHNSQTANSKYVAGDNRISSADSARAAYFLSHPDAVRVSPVFRYEPGNGTPNSANRVFLSNDTIITPTIRYYPSKKP
jgi:hypothetical protein